MECQCKLERQQQSSNVVSLHEFNGTFLGVINDHPVRFVMHVAGHSLYGKAEGAGMVFILMGRLHGRLASGRIIQHQLGSMMQFQARMDADRLSLWLEIKTLLSNQHLPQPFGAQGPAAKAAHSSRAEHDIKLIGMWARQEAGTTNETSVFMEIQADGSYRQGHARTLSAGSNPWAWGWDSAEVSGGKWRTRQQTLYVTKGGTSYWVALASYRLEVGRLHLQFADGSQQLWYRRRRTQVLTQESAHDRRRAPQHDSN